MIGQPDERVELVGGHVVLDFVNTVSWRPHPQKATERIPAFRALLAWARRTELIDDTAEAVLAHLAAENPTAAQQAAEYTRELRETLYAVLVELACSRPTPQQELSTLHRMWLAALERATPHQDMPLHWNLPQREPSDIAHQLAIAGMELLQSTELATIKPCRDPTCGWLFLDRSRSHTRRWCSSTDCGNRERARRHTARRRADGRDPS